MNLSTNTVAILKNFSEINKNILKKFKKDSSDVIEKISNITKINKSVFKIEFIDKFPRNQYGKIL